MRLVVIGGVAAGLSAAARARRIDPSLEIVVLEKGADISYGACGLPYFIEGRVRRAEQLVVYTREYFLKERNILVRTGARVVSISHPRREVSLDGGERVRYDRLVVATGALRRNGLAVTIAERNPHVLGRGDAELTNAVRQRLSRFRVDLQLNTRISDVARYDLAILATGVRPNVEIAAEAGVEVGRTGAIRVDDRMETNLPGVYAAGDCAEAPHLVTGRPAYIPLGTTANKMGRVAGANAAGSRERFGGIVGTAIVNIFGMGVAFSGLSVEQARREGFSPLSARISAPSRAGYFEGRPIAVELVADAGTRRLLGGSVWRDDGVEGRINTIATALHTRMRVEDLEQLDLAYAPPFATVWDPVPIAARQLSKMV